MFSQLTRRCILNTETRWPKRLLYKYMLEFEPYFHSNNCHWQTELLQLRFSSRNLHKTRPKRTPIRKYHITTNWVTGIWDMHHHRCEYHSSNKYWQILLPKENTLMWIEKIFDMPSKGYVRLFSINLHTNSRADAGKKNGVSYITVDTWRTILFNKEVHIWLSEILEFERKYWIRDVVWKMYSNSSKETLRRHIILHPSLYN